MQAGPVDGFGLIGVHAYPTEIHVVLIHPNPRNAQCHRSLALSRVGEESHDEAGGDEFAERVLRDYTCLLTGERTSPRRQRGRQEPGGPRVAEAAAGVGRQQSSG